MLLYDADVLFFQVSNNWYETNYFNSLKCTVTIICLSTRLMYRHTDIFWHTLFSPLHPCSLSHLFAHGLRVSDGGTKETVPVEAAVEPRPMVVSVASVGETPRHQRVELPVHRVTGFPQCTATHSSPLSIRAAPVTLVVMRVDSEQKK